MVYVKHGFGAWFQLRPKPIGGETLLTLCRICFHASTSSGVPSHLLDLGAMQTFQRLFVGARNRPFASLSIMSHVPIFISQACFDMASSPLSVHTTEGLLGTNPRIVFYTDDDDLHGPLLYDDVVMVCVYARVFVRISHYCIAGHSLRVASFHVYAHVYSETSSLQRWYRACIEALRTCVVIGALSTDWSTSAHAAQLASYADCLLPPSDHSPLIVHRRYTQCVVTWKSKGHCWSRTRLRAYALRPDAAPGSVVCICSPCSLTRH